jgi:polyisoprenyl-teichoic acid--peptidoglycan teichoic acid transferase
MNEPPRRWESRAGWDAPTAPLPPGAGAAPPELPPIPAPAYRPASPSGPAYPQSPAYPGSPRSPHLPPGRRRWTRGRILRYSLLALLAVVLVVSALAVHRALDFGSAISTQAPLSTQTGYVSGGGRINLLVLGYGGGNHDGAYLTDSLMVISFVPQGSATTLISVPRDLWVQVPPNSGQYAKINTAYQDGLQNGYGGLPAGRVAGGNEAVQKVTDVIGIPVSYWLTIDFSGFSRLVDSQGGVDINVPTAFTAQYPRNDDPKIDPGWKIIHFNAGPQHMNGAQAIEYARARYVLTPASEGTDFARSARQQLLIRAILGRARQVSAWPGILSAADALQSSIYTNLSLADLALLSSKLDFTHAARIGLTNQNVLVDAQSSDGQDILLPANGDWNAIKLFVAQGLKS